MQITSFLAEVVKESVNSKRCELPIDEWRSMQSAKSQ